MTKTAVLPGRPGRSRRRRLLSIMLGVVAVVGILGANVPTVGSVVTGWYHQYKITRSAYEAKYGLWTKLNIPEKYRVNGVHSTLLYNGDVLIMAGSGNDQAFFNAGGLGLLIGDGKLPNYGEEKIIEMYYSLPVSSWRATFDYQFITNPAYNRDRGPVSVIATRLRAQF